MILLFIITSILYLILTYLVLSLYYRYRKDIEEIENRLLQLEKRINKCENKINKKSVVVSGVCSSQITNKEIINDLVNTYIKREEVSDMACKKGRGGRKK